MSARRILGFVFFGLAILAGLVAGIVYGWLINPASPSENISHTLRLDYKTDVILMIAELYQVETDIALAVNRLSFLGDSASIDTINTAIAYAERHDYAQRDIQSMRELGAALGLLLMGAD